MGTPYSRVYNSFLSKVTDYLYGSFTEEELTQDLTNLLDASIVEFEYPKINIRDKNNENQLFNANLSYDEIEIISYLMVERWLERQINDIQLIKQRFSNKDFQFTSQANHLIALMKNQERLQKKIVQLKRKYSYRKTSDQHNVADFSGLNSGD